MKDEKEQRVKRRQLYPGAPKGQFKQFRHGLSSFIEALAKDAKIKASIFVTIRQLMILKSIKKITKSC